MMFFVSKNLKDHVHNFRRVVEILAHHGLKIKVLKCHFSQKPVALLGHIVSERCLEVNSEKFRVIK